MDKHIRLPLELEFMKRNRKANNTISEFRINYPNTWVNYKRIEDTWLEFASVQTNQTKTYDEIVAIR